MAGPGVGRRRERVVRELEIARLEELRLAAVEAVVDAELACGRHAELVGELQG